MKKSWQDYFSVSQISFLIALGFLLGVAIGSLAKVQFWWLGLGMLVIFVKSLILRSRRLGRLLFLCFGIFLGIFRVDCAVSEMTLPAREFDFSGEVVVIKAPEVKDKYQKVVARALDKTNKTTRKMVKGNLLMFIKPKPTVEFGDHLWVACKLKIPENRHKKFNYRRFLASEKIFYLCSASQVGKLVTKSKAGVLKKIFIVRAKLEGQIERLFPQPESAYLAGLLLGGDDRLPEKVAENFRITGTTHTVAVSGYNITIIVSILMWLGVAIGFWRKQAFLLASLGVFCFVLMIGAPSSANRAALMGILLLWAMQKGRLANSVRVAVFAAAVMVFFSPFILLYDVGFQLSFLATLGIVLVYVPLSALLEIKDDFLELKSIALVTVSAQVGVLGLLIYVFESFSLISLIANIIILPIIPIIMLLGFVVILTGFVLPFFAKLIALVVWALLFFEIFVVEQLAKIPFASITVGDIGIWWLIGYYLFFIGLVFKLNKSIIRQK